MRDFWRGAVYGAMFSVAFIATFALVDTGAVTVPAWVP